jgi:hypothetical protein
MPRAPTPSASRRSSRIKPEISHDETTPAHRCTRDSRWESALAQNTKGTGAETRTTTTTNPEASVGLPTPSDEGSHATRPSGTDRPNMKATKSAQDQYEKEGKSGAFLQRTR